MLRRRAAEEARRAEEGSRRGEENKLRALEDLGIALGYVLGHWWALPLKPRRPRKGERSRGFTSWNS